MKIISFFILLNAFCFDSFSQIENYKITYRHNLQFDTLKTLTDTIGLEAILLGNKFESNYTFAKRPKEKMPMPVYSDKSPQELINAKQSGKVLVKAGIGYDSIGNMLYLNKKKKVILVREKMMNEYILTEEIAPVINWFITQDIRVIKNFTCKKATGYFRGRSYIAWFTTDIPIVAAPWKFIGLPGLVMDIEDDKHQVKLYVEKIEYPVSEKVPSFVEDGNKITLEQYVIFRNDENKKRLKGVEIALMQQEHIQEIISQTGVTPKVKSTFTIYGIEKRLD
jgi:GLPGLI family protein